MLSFQKGRPSGCVALLVLVAACGSVESMNDGSAASVPAVSRKQLSAGQEVWTARHDGPVSGGDTAHAIAVDAAGNTVVAAEVCTLTQDGGCVLSDWQT